MPFNNPRAAAVGLLLAVLLCGASAGRVNGQVSPDAQTAGEVSGTGAAEGPGMGSFIIGEWIGAKLLCRKEENSAVRCGKPEPFSVLFREDGSGSSPDENFPKVFTYRFTSESELTVTPVPEGDELTIFRLEFQKGFLSFQAYIYLPQEETSPSGEVRYIHYMFDVSRAD